MDLVLGTMNFGKRTSEDEARRILDRALERGVTSLDTANTYVEGESERIVGRALRGRRDLATVATKVGRGKVDGRVEGLSRRRVLEGCDASLRRLGMDHVDVLYLHAPDRETPIEETLSALAELLRAGKIRAWATSNYASWQLLEMMTWCDREGLPRPVMAQQIYNLLVRQLDIEYFAFAAKHPLRTVVYNPLAGGLLVGHHDARMPPPGSRFDDNPMYRRRYWSERMFAAVEDYRAVAARSGLSLVSLAYAWLSSRAGVDAIVIGPGTVAHLDDALDACALTLDDGTLRALDELYLAHQGTDAQYARP